MIVTNEKMEKIWTVSEQCLRLRSKDMQVIGFGCTKEQTIAFGRFSRV